MVNFVFIFILQYFYPAQYYSIPVNFAFFFPYDSKYYFCSNYNIEKIMKNPTIDHENNFQDKICEVKDENPLISLNICAQSGQEYFNKIIIKQVFPINVQLGFSSISNRNDQLSLQCQNYLNKKGKKQIRARENKNNIQSKNQKIFKNKKLSPFQSESSDYIPNQKVKNVCDFIYKQNKNRNIIPNEVNQIFSYIQKSSKSGYILQRLFKKYPQNQKYTFKRFYLYQSLIKEQISNYINQNSISLVTRIYQPKCEVYSESEQRYYNKMCRILICHFLQQDSIFNILTSKRMQRQKKKRHLQMRRLLKDKVLKILRL